MKNNFPMYFNFYKQYNFRYKKTVAKILCFNSEVVNRLLKNLIRKIRKLQKKIIVNNLYFDPKFLFDIIKLANYTVKRHEKI